jgi:hypothetical protein
VKMVKPGELIILWIGGILSVGILLLALYSQPIKIVEIFIACL